MRKFAVIDCGTNTFNLLISSITNDKLTFDSRKKRVVKLASNNTKGITIDFKARKRAISTLKFYKELIIQEKISNKNIFCVGTSAVRDATNRNEFIKQIKNACGITILPITGQEEASYIFHGIVNEGVFKNESTLIIDIGGGSVEFIISKNKKIAWKRSYSIGAARILNIIQPTLPLSKSNHLSVKSLFDLELKELIIAINKHNPMTLIGSSGSFDSLIAIRNKNETTIKRSKQENQRLSIDSFNSMYRDLIKKDYHSLLKTPGLVRMRAKMIVPSIMLIKFVLEKMNNPHIIVSKYSLKEGIAYSILKEK